MMTKNFKRNLLYALLFIWAMGLPAFLVVYDTFASQPESPLESVDNWTQDKFEWKPGDEMLPYPPQRIGKYNCTDGTLFGFLYVEAMPLKWGYKAKIMMGKDPFKPANVHVWLVVSDNTGARYIYNNDGLAIPEGDIIYKWFIGREITYNQLLWYARQDK